MTVRIKLVQILIIMSAVFFNCSAQSQNIAPCPNNPPWNNCVGTRTYSNGMVHVGEFQNDKPHGKGVSTFANGNRYEGMFINGVRDGEFIITYSNGNKYIGTQKNDLRNGSGSFYFSDGRKYIGEYKNDKFNGMGTFILANGEKYVGEWKDDKRNGMGVLYSNNGKILQDGIWEDNNFKGSNNIAINNVSNIKNIPLPISENGIYEENEFYKQINCGVLKIDDEYLGPFNRVVSISKKNGMIKVDVKSKYGNKNLNLLQDKKDEFPNCISNIFCRRLDTKNFGSLADIGNLAPAEVIVQQSVFCGRQLDQFIYYTINEKSFELKKINGQVPEKFGFNYDLLNMSDPETKKVFPDFSFTGYFYQGLNGVSDFGLYVEGNEEFGPIALSSVIDFNNTKINNNSTKDLDIYFMILGKLKKYEGKYNRKTKTWVSNNDKSISIKIINPGNYDKGLRAKCELRGIYTDKVFTGTCDVSLLLQ